MLKTLIHHYTEGNKAKFAKLLGVSLQTISAWIARSTFDSELIYTNCRYINAEWLLTGEGDMLKAPTQEPTITNNPAIGTPYYDVDFLGGFNEIFNSQTTVPATNIIIKGFEKADLWCNVTGHSMEPKINHGDIIALRRCTLDDIQYGEIYAVVLNTIRTIKILRRADDPSLLRFVPINREGFDEQDFPLSRILYIYEVIGSISKFF